MSNLLLDWLTNEVNLSQPVFGFGEAFKDGYLLGEILYKYSQQIDFDKFSSRGTPLEVLNNFRRLEPTFRRIGIKLNSKLVAEIMEGKEEVVKRLLYEMKATLEGIARNSRISLNPNLANTKNDKVYTVISTTRPLYDQTISRTFQTAVRGVLENTNEVLMANATKKYTDRTDDYMKTITVGEHSDWDQLTLRRARSKDIYLSKKAHDKQVRDDFNATNVKQWKVNQKVAHDRRDLKQRVENELETRRQNRSEKLLKQSQQYTYDCIDEFDKRLQDMIILPDRSESEVIKSFQVA